MLVAVRQSLLKYFAGLTIASGMGLAVGQLEQVPDQLVVEALSDTEEADWSPEDRARLLQVLSRHQRSTVRAAVAEAFAAYPARLNDTVEEVLARLVRDASPDVRGCAQHALVRCLETSPLLGRVQLLSDWALSEHRLQRHAAARALATPVPIPGADVMLNHLARDPVAWIRRASLEAMAARFALRPGLYRDAAEVAAADPSRSVRKQARRMLARATA
jgi:hypothetical protein